VWDLTINLVASAIAAAAVWLAQYAVRLRSLQRKRRFFGLHRGSQCTFFVSRHASSPNPNSVHRQDMGALVDLAVVAHDCGSRAEIASFDDPPVGIGAVTEFSVGGPTHNPRTAQHLHRLLPGVTVATDDPELLTIGAGPHEFSRERDVYEYMLVARAYASDGGAPVFVLSGQTALSNQAAARYLTTRYRRLARDHGNRPFCLVLRIVDPPAYGSGIVELVADVTAHAFRPAAALAASE